MKTKNYKYDVAFAFSKKDEHLATQINELIKYNLNTFLYSKKLEEVNRTNRELKIMKAIGQQCKVVVVLFSKKWGNTPWTRIEEQTIRKRADIEGYSFLLFIPLDDPPITPKYVPKTQIWEDLASSGLKGAAEIIEERIKTFFVDSKEISKIKSEKYLKLNPNIETQKSTLLENLIGLEVASLELNDLFNELKNRKNQIEKNNKELKLGFKQLHKSCTINYKKFSIKFQIENTKIKSHADSKIYFEILQEDVFSHEPNIIAVEIFHFMVNKNGEYGWVKDNDENSFISSKKLAEESINNLLNQSGNVDDSINLKE